MPEIVVRIKAYQANGSLDWNQPKQIAHWNDGGYKTTIYNFPNHSNSKYLIFKYRFYKWEESGNWNGSSYPSGSEGTNGIILNSTANPPVQLQFIQDDQEWGGQGSSVTLWTTSNKKWTFWFDLIVTGTLFTIFYNGNGNNGGSTNNTSSNWSAYGTVPIASNGFTKTGYFFAGWSTEANGAVNYQAGSTLLHPGAGNITLYAKWEIIRYTVTFEKRINDPPRTSYVTPSYITQDYNTAVTFPILKAVGYTFVRWVDANNNTYTTINNLTGDITLYAVWQKKGTINFSELNRVYNGTRGGNPPNRGVTSISIGKFRAESGQTGTNQIKLITHFQGKGL
jgi:uncharacterized repeat protein (TIGR02543 family)